LLHEGRLVLVTPYAPTAGFSVGAAMGRNKVIYGLAEFGVVASSDLKTGGTWAGAVEALKAEWCPVFVRDGAGTPQGNAALIKAGAIALPESELEAISDLGVWLREHGKTPVVETDLFGVALREQNNDNQ
jgi:predicted Rossmann fold nucleotide-binding protein DprA/Smf involved in DNA uptake